MLTHSLCFVLNFMLPPAVQIFPKFTARRRSSGLALMALEFRLHKQCLEADNQDSCTSDCCSSTLKKHTAPTLPATEGAAKGNTEVQQQCTTGRIS